MDILIDSQKVVTVDVEVVAAEGDQYLVIDINGAHRLLEAWVDLDPKRRRYLWDDRDQGAELFVSWYSEAGGISMRTVSAFWDGRGEWDAHSLEALDEVLPIGTLEYEDPRT